MPRKSTVLLSIKLDKTEEVDDIIEHSDLDTLSYDKQWRLYRLRLNEKDIPANMEIIKDLVSRAKTEYRS